MVGQCAEKGITVSVRIISEPPTFSRQDWPCVNTGGMGNAPQMWSNCSLWLCVHVCMFLFRKWWAMHRQALMRTNQYRGDEGRALQWTHSRDWAIEQKYFKVLDLLYFIVSEMPLQKYIPIRITIYTKQLLHLQYKHSFIKLYKTFFKCFNLQK